MGGCCCCSSRGTQLNSEPGYYYYPRAEEEHLRLSPQHGPTSALSVGLLVDLCLDTSTPDHYRPPPTPIPYDVVLGTPHAPQVAQETCANKNDADMHTTESDCVRTVDKCVNLVESDCTLKSGHEIEVGNESEIELSKSVESTILSTEEDDVCPICLEEYDAENPKLSTKCEHHYHLACILEWMERSDICPVCDQAFVMAYGYTAGATRAPSLRDLCKYLALSSKKKKMKRSKLGKL